MFILTSRKYNLERAGLILGRKKKYIYKVETMQEIKQVKDGVLLMSVNDIFYFLDKIA